MSHKINLYLFNCAILLCFLVSANSQSVHKRFEYKYSFKPPYLAQKDGTVPFWEYGGNAIASGESVRLAPSLRSQKGAIWTKNPINFDWWEVDIMFKVTGRGRIGADGLAFWYTTARGDYTGEVFGSSDRWNGLGVIFDSFDNDNKHNNPYIMAIVNDGTKMFDHKSDGSAQLLSGCLRDFRNKPFPTRARIEYYMNTLTVYFHNGMTNNEQDYELCFRAENVALPRGGYFGLSAATGGLADDHDVIHLLTSSLHSTQQPNAKPISTDEQAKLSQEYQEYQRKLDQQKEDYRKEHPDEVRDKEGEFDDWFESDGQRELRQIFQGQGQIHDILRELNKKVDEVIGKQMNSLSMLSAVYSQAQGQPLQGQPGQGQPPPQSRPVARRKHGKAKRSRAKTKNKFILKLVRTLMNGTEEHLEVDVQCRHRRLLPNNSFVRDLVTILNEKNIKVINNGRVFERNRVTEIRSPRKPPKKVLEKLDVGAPPAARPAPPPPPAALAAPPPRPSASDAGAVQLPLIVAPPASAPPADGEGALLAGGRAGGAPSRPPPAPPAPPHRDFDKRIIVEDFVEVRPTFAARGTARPRALKKRRRRPGPPPADPGAPPAPPQSFDMSPLEDPAALQRASAGGGSAGAGELVYKQAHEVPRPGAGPAADRELAAGKRLLITLLNHNKPPPPPPPPPRRATVARDGDTQAAPRAFASGDVSADTDGLEGGGSEVYDAAEYVVPSQSEEGPSAPPARPPDYDEVSARRGSQPARGAGATQPPLKVVMRSNLTFNLGDEFFRWRARDDDVTSLLGELSIPSNSTAGEGAPLTAAPRAPDTLLNVSAEDDESSSSESGSAGA